MWEKQRGPGPQLLCLQSFVAPGFLDYYVTGNASELNTEPLKVNGTDKRILERWTKRLRPQIVIDFHHNIQVE